MRHCRLGHLADVVVPLLHPESGETESRLTTAAVLLRKVDGELVQDLAGVALEGSEQRTVAVHHDEAKSDEGRYLFEFLKWTKESDQHLIQSNILALRNL